MKIELVRKPKVDIGENCFALAIDIEKMTKLFDEPIACASSGHHDDVGEKWVGQRRAQTLGQQRQQLLRRLRGSNRGRH